ncbi:MAG: potB [Gammaproteobacteria bacterium]|jgi:spermidine/putrescine transport system permease protein|nr:potB [Gammaproteobacteria bacterium]
MVKKGHKFCFKNISVTLIWCWLGFFALIPTFLMLMTSLVQQGDTELIRLQLTFANYFTLFNSIYLKIFAHSLLVAFEVTIICLILGYPFAYILAKLPESLKNLALLFVIIPFWTSSLIRTYAIVVILKTKGLLNTFLLWLGLIHTPLQLLYTNTAATIGLVYSLLPFMILPLYANIEKLDSRFVDAARDLGANSWQVFWKILVPLTLPGIIAGSMLVLLPAMSLFYISNILGGAKTMLIGNLIENQFLAARNWPLGATVSVVLTLFMALMFLTYVKVRSKNTADMGDLL